MKVVLNKDVAFGRGTRPAGTCLGTIDCDPQEALADPSKITPAEGIDPVEVREVRRNHLLVDFVAPEAEVTAPQGWYTVPVADVGLTQRQQSAFTSAGLNTCGEVADYVQAHGSLQGIDGIGEGAETKVLQFIREMNRG